MKCSPAQKLDWHQLTSGRLPWIQTRCCGIFCSSYANSTFQRWMRDLGWSVFPTYLGWRAYKKGVYQPCKLGGLGLRSQVETSAPAFIGWVEMSLSHFTVDESICVQLEELVGCVKGGNRWGTFLEARSRTFQEFSMAWEILRL